GRLLSRSGIRPLDSAIGPMYTQDTPPPNTQSPFHKAGPIVGPPLLFPLLSFAYLWQPLLSGRVLLPTDLSYDYDYLWRGEAPTYGVHASQNYMVSDVAD